MDAFFARNRLSAYLDGALDDTEAAEVAAAIDRDPALKAEYEALRQVVEILRDEGPVPAPDGFHARLMARVDEEPQPAGVVVFLRRTFSRIPVEAVALAAAALVVVIVIQGRPGEELASQPTARVTPAERATPAAKPAIAASEKVAEPEEAMAQAPSEPVPAAESKKAAPSKKASAKGKLEKVGYGSAAPSGATYVPEWEKGAYGLPEDGGALQQDVVAASPEAWRISLSHASSLYDLEGLAKQVGGQIRDDKGQVFVARALNSEDNHARVHLVVPAEQKDATIARLKKLGAVPSSLSGNAPMYGAGQAGFVVDVQYMQ